MILATRVLGVFTQAAEHAHLAHGSRRDSVYIDPEPDVKRLPCGRSTSACGSLAYWVLGGEGSGPQAQWRWRAMLSCLSRSMCLIPMNKLSTDNADTMSAVVKLAEKIDESASHVR